MNTPEDRTRRPISTQPKEGGEPREGEAGSETPICDGLDERLALAPSGYLDWRNAARDVERIYFRKARDLERQLAEAKAEARAARNHMIFQVIKARKAFNSYGSQGHACDCRNACQSIIHSAGAVVPDYEAELLTLRARLAALEADGQRLDWLEKQLQDNQSVDQLWKDSRCTDDLRSAIDAAMKGEKE